MPTYSNTHFDEVKANSTSATTLSSNTLFVSSSASFAGGQATIDAGGNASFGKTITAVYGISTTGVNGGVSATDVYGTTFFSGDLLAPTQVLTDSNLNVLTASTTAINVASKIDLKLGGAGGEITQFLSGAVMYVKGTTLIIFYNAGLNQYYYYLDLSSGDATWQYSATEP